MQWIHDYQLFLFDFDGLLVNTEEIHYQAYIQMCRQRGFHLPWSFPRYSRAAHHTSEGLKDQIYAELPALKEQEPTWSVLYAEKKQAYLDLLKNGSVNLMPGVADLLKALDKAQIRRCVVTHSASDSISMIRKQQPLLDSIPFWITRELYSQPKPSPECYQTAIKMHGKKGDRIIGFEDVPRGLQALQGTSATPILICPAEVYYLDSFAGIKHYPSFTAINETNKP